MPIATIDPVCGCELPPQAHPGDCDFCPYTPPDQAAAARKAAIVRADCLAHCGQARSPGLDAECRPYCGTPATTTRSFFEAIDIASPKVAIGAAVIALVLVLVVATRD